MAEQPKNQAAVKADEDTVLIRVRKGRLLLGRKAVGKYSTGENIYEDEWVEEGATARVPRKWAEKLAARRLETYPSAQPGTFGPLPGVVAESTIDIIEPAAA